MEESVGLEAGYWNPKSRHKIAFDNLSNFWGVYILRIWNNLHRVLTLYIHKYIYTYLQLLSLNCFNVYRLFYGFNVHLSIQTWFCSFGLQKRTCKNSCHWFSNIVTFELLEDFSTRFLLEPCGVTIIGIPEFVLSNICLLYCQVWVL